MPAKPTVGINGAYNSATLENWSMPIGADLTLNVTVNPGAENSAVWAATLTAYYPDGSTLFANSVTSFTSNVGAFTILAANTSGSVSGPYLYRVMRTDSGFVTPLSYGTINLFKPPPVEA